jgi:Sec-independent protein translocase protein TatA
MKAAPGYEALGDDFVLCAGCLAPIGDGLDGKDDVEYIDGLFSEDDDGAEAEGADAAEGAVKPKAMRKAKAAKRTDIVDKDGFDFDAHIARLMARAEGKWTDTVDDFEEEGEEGDEEGEYDEDEDEEEEEEEDEEDGAKKTASRRQQPAGPAHRGQRLDENLLSAILAQYDDDEIGELEFDDPRVMRGVGTSGRSLGAAHRSAKKAARDDEDDDEEDGDEDEEDEEECDEEDEDEFSDDGHQEVDYAAAEDAEGVDGDRQPDLPVPFRSGEKQLAHMMDEYLREREQDRLDAMLNAGLDMREQARKRAREREKREQEEAIAEARRLAEEKARAKERALAEAEGRPLPEEPVAAAPGAAEPTEAAPTKTAAFTVKIGLLKSKPVDSDIAAASSTAASAAAPSHSNDKAGVATASSDAADDSGIGGRYNVLRARLGYSDDVEVPFGFGEGDFESGSDSEIPYPTPKDRSKYQDAATILSTYTNTENHPRMLKEDRVSLASVKTGHAARQLGAAKAAAAKGADGDASGTAGEGAAAPAASYGVIRLSKKTGLPVGFFNGGKQKLSEPIAEEDDEDEDSEADSEDDDSEAEDGPGFVMPSTVKRPKNETPEQRHARKAAVKAERRVKRETKKSLKTAYKNEEVKAAQLIRRREAAKAVRPIEIG